MFDPEAIIPLNINGEEVLAKRTNTALFSFLGELSIYDHIFIAREETPEGMAGAYIFKSSERYKDLVGFMRDQEFMEHSNLIDVPECDLKAFDLAHFKDVRAGESFPEAWVD